MQVYSSNLKGKFVKIATEAGQLTKNYIQKYGHQPEFIPLTQEEINLIDMYVEEYKPSFADKERTDAFFENDIDKTWPEYFMFNLKVQLCHMD